jgi:tubby and related proteins
MNVSPYILVYFSIEVQAFVLNFNGRVDKASVKNFQLIDEFDDNRIHMQFGRIGK